MKKLINNYSRGFDLVSDDFRFIDEAVRLALADVSKAFLETGIDLCILWGCEVNISGVTANVTEGAILFNSEIWHVDAHSFAVPNPLTEPPYWIFKTSYDPSGAKIDEDLQMHNAYQLRYAEGKYTPTGSGIIDYVQMNDISRAVDVMLERSSTNAVLEAQSPVTIGTVNLKKIKGIVHVTGTLLQTLNDSDALDLFILPVGYRPATKMLGRSPVYTSGGANYYYIIWELGVNGKFSARLDQGQGIASEELAIIVPFTSFIAA